jgi:hypothetical protein
MRTASTGALPGQRVEARRVPVHAEDHPRGRVGGEHGLDKIVVTSNWLTIAGLFTLAVSIVAVVLLVTDYIFERTAAVAAAAGIGLLFLVFWCVLPLRGRRRSRD